MLADYELMNVRIGQVKSGDNKDDFFINCEARRVLNGTTSRGGARRATGVKPISIQIWKQQDGELIDVVRSLYPKEGKDADGNPWNGLADIKPEEFDVIAVQNVLHNYNGIDYLTMDGCKMMPAQLGVAIPGKPTSGAFCRKYSHAMNGHAEGDWICGPDGFVKVYTEVLILVRMWTEEEGDYMPGWSYNEQLSKAMRNVFSIERVIAEKPDIVPSFYKGDDIIPVIGDKPQDEKEMNTER